MCLSGLGGLGLERQCEVPGQELVDPADGVVRDPGEHGAEIEFRIEAIQFCRSDKAVHGGGTLATAIGRQFIMPEFWHAKSLSPTRFIH